MRPVVRTLTNRVGKDYRSPRPCTLAFLCLLIYLVDQIKSVYGHDLSCCWLVQGLKLFSETSMEKRSGIFISGNRELEIKMAVSPF